MATIRIQNIYFSDLKNFANSLPSASNFKSFSRSLEQFFLTVGQNNFGNKIPFLKVHIPGNNKLPSNFEMYKKDWRLHVSTFLELFQFGTLPKPSSRFIISSTTLIYN